jgi:nitrate/nitrite-specific signal transduction histidine kinase
MISKSKPIWSSINLPQASLADLERNLGSLSLQYKRQSLELPLSHEKQAVLARLYSAANTLQQAVRKGMVENAIFEIISNLIGCEQVALLVMSKQYDRVDFVGSSGFDPKQADILRRHAKRIMEEAPAESIFIETSDKDRSFLSSLGISARIPFWLDSATQGAIVFFDLLPQRNGLNAGDQELLKLLCAYTGPCLAANKTKHQETLGWVQL